MRTYTPGRSGRAQPRPHEEIPSSSTDAAGSEDASLARAAAMASLEGAAALALVPAECQIRGPPESPLHVSRPPSLTPAHSICGDRYRPSGKERSHSASGHTGRTTWWSSVATGPSASTRDAAERGMHMRSGAVTARCAMRACAPLFFAAAWRAAQLKAWRPAVPQHGTARARHASERDGHWQAYMCRSARCTIASPSRRTAPGFPHGCLAPVEGRCSCQRTAGQRP